MSTFTPGPNQKPVIPCNPPVEQLPRIEKAGRKLPTIGVANIFEKSKVVSDSFGRYLGFTLMMTAILATTGVTATTLFFIAKVLERVLR
jgi:hypothetical protein